jgi:DNA-binding transcriptional LysR family regulator
MVDNKFKDIKCNFNLYRSFYAVAITGSFSEAARLLYVSQPSLSYNVKQLEEQLNVNLFYRKINGVSLTTEGEKLLKNIGQAFDTILEIEEYLSRYNSNNDSLVIGAPTQIVRFFLLPVIDKFIKKNPDIHLKIVEKSTNSLKEMLQKKEIDIMIDTSFTINEDKDIIIENLYAAKCCFAGKKTLMDKCDTINDLATRPLILPSVGGNLRKIIEEYFASNSLKVIPRIEAYTTETILSFVKKEYGIGFFYEGSIKKMLEEGELVKFNDNNLIPSIVLCYGTNKKNRNHFLESFTDLLKKEKL